MKTIITFSLVITGFMALFLVSQAFSFTEQSFENGGVKFEIHSGNTGVICFNHNDESLYSGGRPIKSCTWYCVNYKHAQNAYVKITFIQGPVRWYASNEFISPKGICR